MPNKRNKNQLGARDSLILQGLNNFGHEWIFLDMSPNSYLVRFPYPQIAKEEKLSNINKNVDELWAGKVSTPWAQFSLIVP